MKTIRIISAILALVLTSAALLAGCGSEDSDDASGGGGGVEVVATTMQLQDFARQVGGERVDVTAVLGPDDEPHEYEPTPADADAISGADVVVENGANLDEWLDDLLANAGGEAIRVTAVEGIDLLPTEEEGFPGDPHVWHDPVAAKQMVDNVADGLAEADPDGRGSYERNAEAYKREIDGMSRQIRSELEAIAPVQRKLVTTHDAFGYFGRAYDIDIVGTVLPSVTTETETSGRQVRELVETIESENVEAIFTERGVDPKLERQIAEEAGVDIETGLYADVLGADGSGAEEFIDAELANAEAIAAALTR